MVSVVVCTIPLHNNRPKIAELRNRIKLTDQQFYGLGFILQDTKMAACIFCVYTTLWIEWRRTGDHNTLITLKLFV